MSTHQVPALQRRVTPVCRSLIMSPKSFIALDGNCHLIGAKMVQTTHYDRYTCHLYNSALQYHPEYDTECPWFGHT